jgi:23S rRNA-/tRNA-specific pseudouridylate synthase
MKHPVVADELYGGKLVYLWQLQNGEPVVQNPIIGRVALHAWKLEFKHPTTEKMVEFEAPLPQDMQTLLDLLRKYRKV